MSLTKCILACVVLLGIGYEQVESMPTGISLADLNDFIGDHNDIILTRSRRQSGPPFSRSSSSSEPFIPKINPAPAGSILTYDGKPISTNIGAYSIVPKSERRTPSINRNRPQYATFRGDLPPPIPDIVPRDLPQFKSRGIDSNLSPTFN